MVNVVKNSQTVQIRCSVSPFRTDKFRQSITTQIHCTVNNVLIKATKLFC